MLSFLFCAVLPLLVHAQHNQQTPLKPHQPELVVPLTLSNDRTYTFETTLDGTKVLSTKAVEQIESFREINSHPQTVLITIPLDSTHSGTMVLGSDVTNNIRVQQGTEWIDTLVPGEDVAINHIGIRKGAMVSMDAYATRLALDTPYISLPGEIYDILVMATRPTPHQHDAGYDDVVDCNELDRYPDLVLGLEPETDEEEEGDDIQDRELVITPKQYVLKMEEGQCVLLVRRAYQRGREEVVLGWAAVRGRSVVLDWVNERTGFGI